MMMKTGNRILAGVACLTFASLACAAVTPAGTVSPRVAPTANPPSPAVAAAMRAAAGTRLAPVAVPVDLPSLTVQQLVERNGAARGGQQAWQRVSTMTLAGRLDAGKERKDGGRIAVVSTDDRRKAKAELRKALQTGKVEAEGPKVIQLPFQMELKRPTLTRLEIPFRGQTALQIYDGNSGWKLRPFLGRHEVEPFTPEELKLASDQQELDGPLINYAAKGTSVAMESGELVDGSPAYKLRLTLKNGDVRHLWIDAKTYLDVKMEGAPRRVDGNWRAVATYFRDYKPVEGLMIAHRIETAVEGMAGSQNVFIEKVALNPVLDPTRFARPQ